MKKEDKIFTGNNMVLDKLPAYFLFAGLVLVGWNLLEIISPFVMILMFTTIIATVTFPIYVYFERILKGRKTLASILTCLLVIFAVIIPLSIFLLVLIGQTVDLYKMVNDYLTHIDFSTVLTWEKGNFFYDLAGPYANDISYFVTQNVEGLKNGLTESAKYISALAAKQSAKLIADIGLVIFDLFLIFFFLYFFYKDGRMILRKLMILSPIPVEHEKQILKKFNDISRATIIGIFLTAVAQGVIAWIGFAIAGVPNAFFWATAVSIFSLIPVVGTSVIWFPIGMIMLLGGNWWGGFVLIWGFSLIISVDNVLRVIFIQSKADMNPLLTFLTVFGGILAYGIIGVIFGPVLLVIFLTFLHIYELEYGEVLGSVDELGLDDPKFD